MSIFITFSNIFQKIWRSLRDCIREIRQGKGNPWGWDPPASSWRTGWRCTGRSSYKRYISSYTNVAYNLLLYAILLVQILMRIRWIRILIQVMNIFKIYWIFLTKQNCQIILLLCFAYFWTIQRLGNCYNLSFSTVQIWVWEYKCFFCSFWIQKF